MKYNDPQSKYLLPRFAHGFDWVQVAFDVVVKQTHERSKSIDAPLTIESIHELTNEELQHLYNEYDIAQYYPDLSRETRDRMLFEMCRLYRYLGTPKSIEILCNYIFDGVELNIKVIDNLAFDDDGDLIDPDLLDLFDVQLEPQELILDADAHGRILANVVRFSRNSQTLRNIYYDFSEDFESYISMGIDANNPCVTVDWLNDEESEPIGPVPPVPEDDPAKPLTFKATADGSSVTLTKTGSPSGSFEYSTDGGSTWSAYTIDTAISLNNDDSVSFRAVADRTSDQSQSKYFYFVMSGTVDAYHNAMSILYHSDYENKVSLPIAYALYRLFNNGTSLTRAPLLPATTLSVRCYQYMFSGCTSLVTAPSLPATTLADYCYAFMFNGCTSLVTAPSLPATTLAVHCYEYMFDECTSLVTAPSLPATTLADYCYRRMFESCSLVRAPELPAETVSNYAYHSMFRENYSLNYIKCHATSFGTAAVSDWAVHVSATGDFYANPNTTWQTGTSGIPSGWTRHDLT